MVNSQIQPATLLNIINKPMKTMIWFKTGAFSTGLTITRSIMMPAINDAPIARTRQPRRGALAWNSPSDEGREHRHFALGEVKVVGGLVDHHHSQRDTGVNRTDRETREG